MADDNEMIVIEMPTSDRIRLSEQIRARMEAEGIAAYDYDKLELGFHLPAHWPAGIDAQPTFAQLVVMARRLKMRIGRLLSMQVVIAVESMTRSRCSRTLR